MFIREFDYLSPQITLYYKGSSSHSSIISGIISIISFCIIFSFGIYFFLDLIERKNPESYYLNRFVEDAGEFPINSSSLFHFLTMSNLGNQTYRGFDFRSFRLIGFDTNYVNYLKDKNLENFDHWIYGLCNNEIDIEKIDHLIKIENFNKCACIRKYYNALEKKYYDTNEKEFKWPKLSHGNLHPDPKNYQIIVDKCDENTLKLIFEENYKCKNDNEIDKYFSGDQGINFYFIDHYIDISNYEEPNRKFLYRIENILSNQNYSVNHINFNPSLIKTHNGIVFDNSIEEFSYLFDRNDAFTYPIYSYNVYIIYCLWLKNRMLSYERSYKRIQDIISDIGGITEFVNFVATFLICSYNKYIVLLDTEKLLFSCYEKSEEKNQKNNININNINDASSYNELLKLKENKQLIESTKSLATVRNLEIKNLKYNFNKNDYLNKKNYTNPLENIITNKSRENIIDNKPNIFNNTKRLEYKKFKKNKIESDDNVSKNKIPKLNFCEYLYYKLTCNKNKNNLENFNDFRTRIISEEYFIKNHLNIYILLKINENLFSEYKNRYHLKDIINLV